MAMPMVFGEHVPRSINYQGQLSNSEGNPVADGGYLIKFKIYGSASGDDSLWSSGFQTVKVENGLFNYMPGFAETLPDEIFAADSNRYLGITIESDEEIVPRTKLVSVPYAYQALHADTAEYSKSGTGGSGYWTVSDSVLYTNGLWGLARGNAGNVLYGDSIYTMVNLGAECTTGKTGEDKKYNTISGGYQNTARENFTSIGGGELNFAKNPYSSVCGGKGNTASGWYSHIGGGDSNTAYDTYSSIVSGYHNFSNGHGNIIGNGGENYTSELYSLIGTGVRDSVFSCYSAVLSGGYNIAGNEATDTSAFVGSGFNNRALSKFSIIGGGRANLVEGDYSAILGGFGDTISATADHSYLFGINSKLTEDSTFMVDMPHIHFGDESSGYDFPGSDGSAGQFLATNGSGQLSWSNGSGFSLPFDTTVNLTSAFNITNTKSNGACISGFATNSTGTNYNYGGHFRAASYYGIGVYGAATNTEGLGNCGGHFISQGNSGMAIYGYANGPQGYGIYSLSTNTSGRNYGGYFEAFGDEGMGIYAKARNTTTSSSDTTYGGYFESEATYGMGVYGKGVMHGGKFIATNTGYCVGVSGEGNTHGGSFQANSGSGIGVYGESPTTGAYTNYGGYFEAGGDNGLGVYGEAPAYGGSFKATGSGGTGVCATGSARGGFFQCDSSGGKAVWAKTMADGNTIAVYGYAGNATTLDTVYGGYFKSEPDYGIGAYGISNGRYGVGLQGNATDQNAWGVLGDNEYNDNHGVLGHNLAGVYGWASAYDAGRFNGNVTVIGNLSKGSGSFKIDHPLDPENKYLYHSFVESPDMMNVYNGNILLDANGTAIVRLPDYFEALNRDFRYQLTAIGAPGPNLYVAQKISGNQFAIAGGEPGMEVSWQVTGIRKDPYAEQNRIQVEVEKEDYNKGLYIYPKEYGFGDEKSIEAQEIARTKKME
jgi:hypothetical protein